MLKHLALIEVFGLFNVFEHHRIQLSDEPHPTIISGPNGSGKTQTLRLVKAVFDLDLAYLASVPYRSLRLTFQNGERLEVSRSSTRKGDLLSFKGRARDGREHSPINISLDEIIDQEQAGRETFRRYKIAANRDAAPEQAYLFDPNDPALRSADIEEFFLDPLASEPTSRLAKTGWLKALVRTKVVIVETKRLHAMPPGIAPISQGRRRKHQSILQSHLERINAQVAQAREASLLISQERDQSFPMRILSARDSHSTLRAASMERLQRMYDSVHELGAELHSNGLSALPKLMEFPDHKLAPFERRILTQFVQDWRKKFEPLLPVNDRIQTLRGVLNEKLRFKKAEYDSADGLQFRSTISGETIPVAALSSGEQHLVVLFTSLLFSATPGSIVLIDEPEISMHAAWQHSFLDDISRVAEIQDLQVVLATHSAAIVKGHWELVQEIGVE
ncbi:AAA family ATPase [Streptomyces massasporeus]|uniref:AAA family ATPase n=1 Tax=Streptomyces massasporeus TaxID=67324 RepID=UPI0033BC1D9B